MAIVCIGSRTNNRKEVALTGSVTNAAGVSESITMTYHTITRISIPLSFCEIITLHRANDTIATFILTDYRHILDIDDISIRNTTNGSCRRHHELYGCIGIRVIHLDTALGHLGITAIGTIGILYTIVDVIATINVGMLIVALTINGSNRAILILNIAAIDIH